MTTTAERHIEKQRVVGSGGRVRTVYVCEFGCWHGSYATAKRCKNALAKVGRAHTVLVHLNITVTATNPDEAETAAVELLPVELRAKVALVEAID